MYHIIRFLAYVVIPALFAYGLTVTYINRDTLIFSILLVAQTLILFEIGYRYGREKL
jgi:hypothetical protein